MKEPRLIDLALQMLINKSEHRIENMGYKLHVVATGRSNEEPSGIAAIITGDKLAHMTDAEREAIQLAIPSHVTPNDGKYHHPNEPRTTFPVSIQYIIQK